MSSALAGSTVLVTGAGGFIGPHVVAALRTAGATVRAIAGAPGQAIARLPAEVDARIADVADRAALPPIVDGADAVVHLAGPASVSDSFDRPAEYARVHLGGTVNVLDACRHARVRRFVYLSSAEVYGRPLANPVDEDALLAPRSPYGAAKAAAEFAARAFAATYGIDAVVLRPFSIYGPGVAPASLVGTIARQALHADRIELADIRPVRDYCYVADLAAALVSAAAEGTRGYRVFNVGSGVGVSVEQVAAAAARASGRSIPVVADPSRRRPAAAEIFTLVADPTHALAGLSWRTTTTLDEGLAKTLQWFGEQRE
jgi:nucleoside-diphosphate-sugar epimerase